MFADHQRANLAADAPAGVALTVIAPTVELVGSFEVNEGLMRIDMDYGHLRAQEVTAGLDPATQARAEALTDRIIVARDHAWFAEEALWRDPSTAPPDLTRLEVLKAIVARRPGRAGRPRPGQPWLVGRVVRPGGRCTPAIDRPLRPPTSPDGRLNPSDRVSRRGPPSRGRPSRSGHDRGAPPCTGRWTRR